METIIIAIISSGLLSVIITECFGILKAKRSKKDGVEAKLEVLAEEQKEIEDEDCYMEIVFENKENINVADEISYDNITAMLVDMNDNVIYLSQEEDVLKNGNFGIGLAVPDELIEESFGDLR